MEQRVYKGCTLCFCRVVCTRVSRAARLLTLLQVLRRHRRPVTAATLALELGVTPRTIYRDIAMLTAQGTPIAGEAGVGYALQPGAMLPPLAFTPDEADALALGLRFVRQRGDPALASAADNALAKLEAVRPSAASPGSEALLVPPRAASPHLGPLRQAIRAERRVLLSYRDAAGALSERQVWPVAVGFFGQAEVLAAWCETRDAFRHFRLDRIVTATPTPERMPRPHRRLLAEWRDAMQLYLL